MSIGGDEYGAGEEARSGTRTRLPGEDSDVYDVGRTPSRPGRSLLMVVGVVVLLIAAIAFANRGGGNDGGHADHGGAGGAAPTAPTGRQPVRDSHSGTGIPSGFAHTKQGAQSAAANYAVALVSARIIQPSQRAVIIHQVFAPAKVDGMRAKMNKAYSPAFLAKLDLKNDGTAQAGMTYVSRTAPVGTKVNRFDGDAANVDVWCTGVFGMAGKGSTNPVTSDWFTMQFDMTWTQGDWKVTGFAQKDGPAPVTGDNKASTADEIAKAVEQYGGFTYAR